jgi:catechol 2,3-dioxygenase-like lactoylglutathione lyase family enzyme
LFRLHHVNVLAPVGRGEEVAAFYADVLGLTRVPKPAQGPSSQTGAWFDVPGGTQVHVSERAGAVHPEQHFALVADDFDALAGRLPGWQDRPAMLGARRGETRDPAGNLVEIIEAAGAFG